MTSDSDNSLRHTGCVAEGVDVGAEGEKHSTQKIPRLGRLYTQSSTKRGFVREWEDLELFWFGAALRNHQISVPTRGAPSRGGCFSLQTPQAQSVR